MLIKVCERRGDAASEKRVTTDFIGAHHPKKPAKKMSSLRLASRPNS